MARLSSEVELRLEEEKDFLERYFYPEKFPILRETGEPCFEREVKFRNGDVYKLRVCITEGYPDVLPDLVVSQSPQPMPSTRLWCGSHAMHTYPRRPDGLLRICYFHPARWTRENKIYQVFKKGKKWLKVYVLRHLVRRKPMNFYLKDMVPTQEDEMRVAAWSRRLQAGQRAILNNPISSPEPLFLHQMVREFISTLTALPDVERKILIEWSPCFFKYVAARSRVEAGSARAILNGPTVSADGLSPYQMGREFFSWLKAIPDVERIKLFEWNQHILANLQF